MHRAGLRKRQPHKLHDLAHLIFANQEWHLWHQQGPDSLDVCVTQKPDLELFVQRGATPQGVCNIEARSRRHVHMDSPPCQHLA